jgi:hypothetical protein
MKKKESDTQEKTLPPGAWSRVLLDDQSRRFQTVRRYSCAGVEWQVRLARVLRGSAIPCASLAPSEKRGRVIFRTRTLSNLEMRLAMARWGVLNGPSSGFG